MSIFATDFIAIYNLMYSETTLLLCTPSCKLEHEGQRQLRINKKPKKKKILAPTGTQNAGRGCAIRVHRRHFSIPASDVSSVVRLVPAHLSRLCLALLLLISTSQTVAGAIAHESTGNNLLSQ
jgi:hypothetical protein